MSEWRMSFRTLLKKIYLNLKIFVELTEKKRLIV